MKNNGLADFNFLPSVPQTFWGFPPFLSPPFFVFLLSHWGFEIFISRSKGTARGAMSGRGRRRKNTRGRPRQSRTTAPASAAQSSREGAGSAGRGNSSSGDPSSHVVTARRTPASGGSSSACAVARNPVRRSSRQKNLFVTPGQNSGSARGSSEQSSGTAPAPSIRDNALYASQSTGVRGNATYQPGYHAAAAQARTAARAEARIDGRRPDVSIGMVERHVAPPAGTTSPAAAPNSRRRQTREVPLRRCTR